MEVLQRTANRGSIATGGYDIANSLKLEADNSELMERGFSSIGTPTSDNKATISWWVKRTELQPSGNHICLIGYSSNTMILGFNNDRLSAHFTHGAGTNLKSSAVFRDTSAWYHLVWAFDTTQATASNRAKMYVNGVQITDFDTETYPTQNSGVGLWEVNMGHYIGWSDAQCQSGYHAEIYLIDGQQLAPTDFGEFDADTGIWKPKEYTGTFGNEGYYLDFENASSLGADASGNGNNFGSLYNITSADQATDTPTNNFCTINNLVDNAFAIFSLTEGGTRGPNTGEGNKAVGTFAVSKGKWYWEGVTTAAAGTNYWMWGITRADMQQGYSDDPGQGSAWYSAENTFLTQTGVGASSPTYDTGITSYTVGDIWSISLNCDVNPYEITLRFNNSVPGTAANNTNRSVGTFASEGPVMPFYFLYNIASDDTWHNFGNPFIATLSGGNTDENGYGDFKYTPPSGYYALCSKNLAEFG